MAKDELTECLEGSNQYERIMVLRDLNMKVSGFPCQSVDEE